MNWTNNNSVKSEEEERRQRHLHHLFVCVIFFISPSVCLCASEWVFLQIFFFEFLSPLLVKWSQCVCIYCVRVCVCIIFLIFHCETRRKRSGRTGETLSLSLSTLVCLDCHPKSVFWLRLLAAHCVSSSRDFSQFQFSAFQGRTRCHLSVTAVWPPSLIIITIWWFQVCVHRPSSVGDLLGALCARQKKRREKKKEAQWGSPTPYTHPKPPTAAAASRAASRFSSPFCPLGKRKVVAVMTRQSVE